MSESAVNTIVERPKRAPFDCVDSCDDEKRGAESTIRVVLDFVLNKFDGEKDAAEKGREVKFKNTHGLTLTHAYTTQREEDAG